MLQRYRGPLLAGLIFAAFLIAFLALVRPGAFAQTMGEYGGVLNNSTSDDRFKPLQMHPSPMGPQKFDSQVHTNSGNEFQNSDIHKDSDTFKSRPIFDTKDDFKSSDFKSSDDFKPSLK